MHAARMETLKKFLSDLKNDLPDFEGADFSDINWCTREGRNALHVAVMGNRYDMAKALIEEGIKVNARGDMGHTPLHDAVAAADMDLIKLLVESGADVHALTEGEPAFSLARRFKREDICEYLSEVMKTAQREDPTVWAKAQIAYLKREIMRIEKQYGV